MIHIYTLVQHSTAAAATAAFDRYIGIVGIGIKMTLFATGRPVRKGI